jgi:ankyrin repeat protein
MVYLANRGSVCERHYRFIRATEAATALEAEGGGEEETSVDADGEGEGESKEGGAGGKKGADMPALMAEVDMTEYRLPSASLWTTLLCLPFDDLHEQTVGSSALISAIKGGHTALALALINNRVTVDQVDSFSTTPLVYALTLNNEAVVSALLATGADVDRIDPNGNPTLKHAFVCLTTSDLAIVMSKAPSVDSKVYYGHAALVPIVLESRPDAQVSDSEGNAPLHYALGLAKASLSIGGNIISIKGGAYVNMIHTNSDNSSDVHYSRSTILTTCIALLEAGVNVNFCNKDGIAPLHIAAANSHVSLIQKFIEYKAAANVLDNNGFLPLHFFAACCPPETISGVQGIEMFEFLMGVSDNRDLNQLTYTDLRTEKSKEERQVYDIDNAFDDIFQEALLPSCIAKRRLASSSLLSATTSDKYNMLQLLMCGHVLGCSNITPFTVQSLSVLDNTGASSIDVESYHALARQERCKLIIYLLTEYLVSPKNDDGQEDTEDWRFVTRQFLLNDSIVESNFTIAHALSLLLQGESVRTPLTDQQKRSKKVKYYESEELQVIALMGSRFDTDCMNSACSTTISSIVLPSDIKNAWTPIHAIMSVNNGYLLSTVLEDIDMSDPLYSNLPEVLMEIISSNSSTNTSTCSTTSSTNTLSVEQRSSVFTVLLTAITKMKNYSDYLKPSLLYKAAIDLQSPALVSILIKCPQLNPNSLHESSPSDDAKCTALHQICTLIGSESDDSSKYYNVLDAFATNPDRLDLLVEDPYGNTCVDIAIQSRNFKLLKALVSMRKMDVIERLILSRYGGPSLLMELESENLQLAKDCGFAIQPFPAPLVAEAGIAIPTGEEVGEGKQQVEASVETMGVGSDMEIGGVSLTEDASLPMFTADDGGHAEITVVGSDNTTNSINPTTEQDMANLTRSNEAVYFVLELVGQLVGSDCHVDNCYYEGLVFSDYCDRVKKEMNEEMAKLESQTNEMVVNENTMESMPTEVEVEVTVS